MFVAWRDLRFAKGRFALMGTVVVLITLLVGLLSGLTAGLARDNTVAVTSLPADRLAFAAPPDGQEVSFTNSSVGESAWRDWAKQPGVDSAEPIGIRTVNGWAGDRTVAVAAFGVEPGAKIAPASGDLGPGKVVLSTKAAEELNLAAGDTVRLGDVEETVAAVEGGAMYSHQPVVWTSLDDWQKLGHSGTSTEEQATVVALKGSADWAAGDKATETRSVPLGDSLAALASYQAENGSLQLMRGFLFAISALVVGAFFTVWTIQRSGDIAVLKALGASTPYLLKDALGQAVVLLTLGTLLGTALATLLGASIGGAVPFVLEAATLLVPALVMIALGIVGAALSIRRITAVDPLTALGSAR
ncbi:ABC transporter substrate-binding protein [Streptomyces spiroverticillatus]|uniref:ABC transporter substrate-binding protein n=1 Tax=Streptomyces finlayi TaxID=67296 RepID=A0A919C904_9ACTN|nr:ABC transporter permease [Streptomyces finlayi]GHA01608.1 ABC transporter substrate-binding protein [Streptomyces spiroverticillatus]GHC85981.1 ABC transporter substrate-binding protein [Streptomyces finlayi]